MIPTILISVLLAAACLWIVIRGICNWKRGKYGCSCGGSCGSCGMKGACHAENEQEKK